MSDWRVETVEGGVVRRAGAEGAPALWFVHALGDSGSAFLQLLSGRLSSAFELFAPDLPGAGVSPIQTRPADLEALPEWLARAIGRRSATVPVGVVGHSLGAAVAVRAVRRLRATVLGVFSIEGNLTEADAYLSGEAVAFQNGEAFQDHLLRRVRTLAQDAASGSAGALWRYHANVTLAEPDALLDLGQSARAASAGDGLGTEYRALTLPSHYYWSPENTPPATQAYVRRHALRSTSFRGGHWPMVEESDATAREIASFFEPLLARHRAEGVSA
jgi:pimeloyl-ACP methyl ester carboxylesterase